MSRIRYVVQRTLVTAVLILLVATALFLFFRFMPGDYTALLIQQGMSPEQAQRLQAKWGLDAPLYVQYFRYITNMLTADAGESFRFGQPVWELVRPRILNSFILVAPAITATYIIGGLLGAVIGRYRGGLFEKSSIIGVSVFHSIPDFFLGILLIAAFSETAGLFPTSGMLSPQTSIMLQDQPYWERFLRVEFWMHYVLPFATITLYFMQYPALIMRNSVVEVSGQEFLHYHRLKGIPRVALLRKLIRHASLLVGNDSALLHVASGVGSATLAGTANRRSRRWSGRNSARRQTLGTPVRSATGRSHRSQVFGRRRWNSYERADEHIHTGQVRWL